MPVPVMQIGVMWVSVSQRFMTVPVRMRLAVRAIMPMLVVFIMNVSMFVFERIMLVFVLMVFGYVHPKSETHHGACKHEPHRQRFVQNRDRNDRADKGRQREVGACSGRTEVAQGEDEEHEAHADTEKPDKHCAGDDSDRREGSASKQSKSNIHRAGDHPFGHGDHDRIG